MKKIIVIKLFLTVFSTFLSIYGMEEQPILSIAQKRPSPISLSKTSKNAKKARTDSSIKSFCPCGKARAITTRKLALHMKKFHQNCCLICEKTFKVSTKCVEHLSLVHKLFSIIDKNKLVEYQANLEKEIKRSFCPCGETVNSRKRHLALHMKKFHQNSCPLCGETFKESSKCVEHLSLVHKLFSIIDNDKLVDYQDDLEKEKEKEVGVIKSFCPCGKTETTDIRGLDFHLDKFHYDESTQMIKCPDPDCEEKFEKSRPAIEHLSKDHELFSIAEGKLIDYDKNLVIKVKHKSFCPCGKVQIRRKKDLATHIRRLHHNTCLFCKITFKKSSQVVEHLSLVHKLFSIIDNGVLVEYQDDQNDIEKEQSLNDENNSIIQPEDLLNEGALNTMFSTIVPESQIEERTSAPSETSVYDLFNDEEMNYLEDLMDPNF